MGFAMKDKNVLIIIADGYHEHEFWFPYYRFKEAGANVFTASPEKGIVIGEGKSGKDGLLATTDYSINEVKEMDFDGIFLPGGIYCPLELRINKDVTEILLKANQKNKWIAAICHAPWILISAGLVKGKKIACPDDMADDVINAGGIYISDGAVADGNIYTAVYFGVLPELFNLLI